MTKCKTCGQEIKVEKTIQKIPAKTLIWGKISDKKLTWDEAVNGGVKEKVKEHYQNKLTPARASSSKRT
jgi:hypothetical protein